MALHNFHLLSDHPVKIAYFINQYPKTSHSFVRREIHALERSGIQVSRFALRGWDQHYVDAGDRAECGITRYLLQGGLAPLLTASLRRLVSHPGPWIRALRTAIGQWRGGDRSLPLNVITHAEGCLLAQWCEQQGIGHVHAHFGTNSAAVARLAHQVGGPTYSFTVHGPDEFDSPRSLALGAKVAEARFTVGISHYTRSQLRRWVSPEHADRVHVVHCGLDRSFLEAPTQAVPDSNRILCIGRLSVEKAQNDLVEAVARLVQRGIDVELVLAGDGDLRADIEARIARHGLEGRVRMTGWIDEAQVRDELLRCRAFVLPSRAEGLPVVLMEALALGRPVITTYIAGIPELVASSRSGWLIPSGDVDTLSAAIETCLSTPVDELSAMGARGRQQVLAQHDIDIEAARLAELLRGQSRGDCAIAAEGHGPSAGAVR